MIGINVDMPKNCAECPCLRFGEYCNFEKSWCALPRRSRGYILSDRRPEDCPLVELEGENNDQQRL